MAKTIIVSNRLPVKIHFDKNKEISLSKSAGGLATGLSSIYQQGDNVWVGWPGGYMEDEKDREAATKELRSQHMKPVFLTQEEMNLYYEGFSNETLWPLFHYFNEYTIYNQEYWESYRNVNQKFLQEVLEVAEPEDTIWIQDYHLLLLPALIREKLPEASIGFFLHIPFPSFEIFRLIPWRKELLEGMLGADLIGVHTYDDMRHFLSAVNRLRFLSNKRGHIVLGNRTIAVDSFPMGIDYEKYAESAGSPEALSREVKYRTSLGNHKIIVSIDRLDYTKGIPNRLKAFDLFLEQYPEYRESASILMVVVPSRDQVGQYKELKEEVDLLVGRINGKYGTVNWTPIHYFYRSFDLADISAFYRIADVALVTPMRDGMNLVAKEYVASRLDKTGVLVLSEMAGASKELSEALIVNPSDIHRLVETLHRALTMEHEEQTQHMSLMQETLKTYNIHHWVNLFLGRLEELKQMQEERQALLYNEKLKATIGDHYRKAKKRMIILDYDGTLKAYTRDPMEASPDEELLELLRELAEEEENILVVISGRDHNVLGEWLQDLPINLICEHGAFMRKKDEDWRMAQINSTGKWKDQICDILQMYVNRTPGSFIEEKKYSLAWHYRRVETGLGELRSREIISHLRYLTEGQGLQVLDGNNVIEIKDAEVHKGLAAKKLLEDYEPDFILAIGDDQTDEDTFLTLPDTSYTFKVGAYQTAARYYLKDAEAARALLHDLMNIKRN